MRTLVLLLALVSTPLTSQAQVQAPRLVVAPLISSPSDSPAFVVDCRNESAAAVSSWRDDWLESIRVDGVFIEEKVLRGTIGQSTMIPPGEAWRGVVVLSQEAGVFPRQLPRASMISSRLVPLSEGLHSVAVRCRGGWSNDVPFYWVPPR